MSASRLRIATFNLENLDDGPGDGQAIDRRVAALRPILTALDADILCMQEINAQPSPEAGPRRFTALDRLLEQTKYAGSARATTHRADGGPADVHNLVTVSRLPLLAHRQVRHDFVAAPLYRAATARPLTAQAVPIEWDRPILQTTHDWGGRRLHIVNVHLRAPVAAFVSGQKLDALSWRTAAGWAEGFFIAAMKRTGQALEARLLVDRLFDEDPAALIAVCGDFNAELAETPLRAVRADSEDTMNGGLATRALVPVDALVPEDRRYTVIHGGRKIVLDHILVSNALGGRVTRVDITNQDLPDELRAFLRAEAWPGSFHAPIVAEFAFDVPDGA